MNYQLKQIQYGGYFDVDNKEIKIKELEELSLSNGFWNREDSNDIVKKLGDLKKSTSEIKIIKEELETYKELIKVDESYKNELYDTLEELSEIINRLELETKLSGEYDSNNAFLELHSGAGGTEESRCILREKPDGGQKKHPAGRTAGREGVMGDSAVRSPGEVAHQF